MKIRILILTLSIFFSFTSYSQSMIGDTITIYIENKVELKIAIDDFSELKDSSTFITNHLEKFQTNLPMLDSAANGLSSEDAEKVVYIPNEKMTLEKVNKQIVFQFDGEKTSNTGFRDQAILQLNCATVYITTNDLSDLSNVNLAISVTKMIDSLPAKTRNSVHQFFQYKNDKITVLHNKEEGGNGGDQIELSFDAGANLIKNKFVGDIEFRLGLKLLKKGITKHSPYASLTLLYDFPSNRKTNINMFLNTGYDFYNKNKFNIGLEYGYLIRKQGDFFENGTSRFGLNIATKSKLNISPYIYVNKGFKSAYPGLRLGLSF